MTYDLLGVLLLSSQDPARWPPVFANPWCATSLSEVLGGVWYKRFRQTVFLGAYLFSLILGRASTGIPFVSGFPPPLASPPVENVEDACRVWDDPR